MPNYSYGQLVHGEVDVVAVANTTYTLTLYDVNGAVRTLTANERLVITSLMVSVSSGTAVVFFDTNADGTPTAGEELYGVNNVSGLPVSFAPGMAGPVGIGVKIRVSAAGQMYAEVVARIVDQNAVL